MVDEVDARVVALDPPRTVADVWDDRLKMLGSILVAILLILGAVFMAMTATPENTNAGIVIGGFVTAIPIAVRYFMNAGGGQ